MLPEWATQQAEGVYVIDADTAYPALQKELGVAKLDQYWLEVLYQFAKMDLRRALILNNEDPWPARILIRGDKSRWAHKHYPPGRGVEAATEGREARELYRKMRRFVPN